MRIYLKHILTFLKALAISLLFGGSWAITFYTFDEYADVLMPSHRNDFFFDIALFFLSGLVGAFLFFLLMIVLRKLNDIIAHTS